MRVGHRRAPPVKQAGRCGLALAAVAVLALALRSWLRHGCAEPHASATAARGTTPDAGVTATRRRRCCWPTPSRACSAWHRRRPPNRPRSVTAAREAYERAPQGSAQLRYALLLATPGTSRRAIPQQAQTLLRELAAQPETLAPVERAVALVELAQLDRRTRPAGDNDRLQADRRRARRSGAHRRRAAPPAGRARRECQAAQAARGRPGQARCDRQHRAQPERAQTTNEVRQQ